MGEGWKIIHGDPAGKEYPTIYFRFLTPNKVPVKRQWISDFNTHTNGWEGIVVLSDSINSFNKYLQSISWET